MVRRAGECGAGEGWRVWWWGGLEGVVVKTTKAELCPLKCMPMHRVLHFQYIYCLQFYLMYLKSVSSLLMLWVTGCVLPLALLTTELSHLASHIEDNSLHLQPP